jgi:hypothetical protein
VEARLTAGRGSRRRAGRTSVDPLVRLDDADAEPGEIELARLHQPGCSAVSPADERAAGLAAAVGDPADELGDLLGSSMPTGHVVEEERAARARCRRRRRRTSRRGPEPIVS